MQVRENKVQLDKAVRRFSKDRFYRGCILPASVARVTISPLPDTCQAHQLKGIPGLIPILTQSHKPTHKRYTRRRYGSLFNGDGALGRCEDGLQAQAVPSDNDAHHALLVGNEQDHRDRVLQEKK